MLITCSLHNSILPIEYIRLDEKQLENNNKSSEMVGSDGDKNLSSLCTFLSYLFFFFFSIFFINSGN